MQSINPTTMNILKRCPFCGGEAHIRELLGGFTHEVKHAKNCVGIPGRTTVFKDPEKSAQAWNRRHNDAVFEFEGEAILLSSSWAIPCGAGGLLIGMDKLSLIPGKKYKVIITEI